MFQRTGFVGRHDGENPVDGGSPAIMYTLLHTKEQRAMWYRSLVHVQEPLAMRSHGGECPATARLVGPA